MDLSDFAHKLTLYDSKTMDNFKSYMTNDPNLCSEIITTLLLSQEWGDDPSLCGYAMQHLQKMWGPSRVAEWITGLWPSLPWIVKRKILYCIGYSSDCCISTDLALRLFEHPAASVNDRHLILAGLAATAEARDCVALLFELIPKIGRHNDPERQATLDGLVRDIHRSYGGR